MFQEHPRVDYHLEKELDLDPEWFSGLLQRFIFRDISSPLLASFSFSLQY
jgi:hypothetical protein